MLAHEFIIDLKESTRHAFGDDVLSEVNWRHALAAGALAAGVSMPIHTGDTDQFTPHQLKHNATINEFKRLVTWISSVYQIDHMQAKEIVTLAKKYEQPDFPKAKDILAVVGTESSFDVKAKSKLKKDPAVGLMQVRPKTNGLDTKTLKLSPEAQIKEGVKILNYNYKRLGDKDAALHAYNLGVRSYLNGERNENYVKKFKTIRRKLG